MNLELVLQSVGYELMRIGEWVNVIGYVTATPKDYRFDAQSSPTLLVEVQALLVWPTGPLDVQSYERGFETRLDTQPDK